MQTVPSCLELEHSLWLGEHFCPILHIGSSSSDVSNAPQSISESQSHSRGIHRFLQSKSNCFNRKLIQSKIIGLPIRTGKLRWRTFACIQTGCCHILDLSGSFLHRIHLNSPSCCHSARSVVSKYHLYIGRQSMHISPAIPMAVALFELYNRTKICLLID